MSRHEAAIRALLPDRPRSARKAVTRSLEELRADLGDDSAAGSYAIRAFRPRAMAMVTNGDYAPAKGDRSTSDSDDQHLLARAFGRLPEPWQAVLWHSHVEQLSAAEVSPFVGRTVSEVGELLATAERGLTDALIVEYRELGPLPDDVERIIPLLSGYVRGALPPHEERIVDAHLSAAAPEDPDGSADAADRDAEPAVDVDADDSAGDAGVEDSDDGDAVEPDAAVAAARVHTPDDTRRLIELASSLPTVLAPAVAPGITGTDLQHHRRALGTTTRAVGADALNANRNSRARRAVILGSAATVVAAVAGLAYLANRSDTDRIGVAELDSTTAPGSSSTTTTDNADTTTTTTELELRPSGPANEIELVVQSGLRADGLESLDTDLVTTVSAAAPVLAGGTGTLDLSISNPTDEPIDANVELMLPRGVVLDALAAGDAQCVDPTGDSPYCDVAVGPGDVLDFSVRLSLETAVTGRLTVAGESLTAPFETAVEATPDLVHNSVGRGDVTMIGNTVMSCNPVVAAERGIDCAAVTSGVGDIVNRWDVPMTFTGAAPAFGLENGSSAVLGLPEGASVVSAQLFWAGDLDEAGRSVPGDTLDSVTLVLPNGESAEVEAEEVRFGEEDATQYIGQVDVTELVASGGAGGYLVGNIASVEVQGSFGAWALVVVTDDDSLPRRHRIVTYPFQWVAPDGDFEYGVDIPVPVVSGANGQLDVLGFEGERGFAPETLMVDGEDVGGPNPFDSTIVGERDPAFDNNLGVDIDAYDLVIDAPTGTLTMHVRSDDDGIRVAVIGLTVDIDV